MLSNKQKEQRADRARANGAKSKGAITPEGQLRARTASLQHGLYAQDQTLAHTVDPVRYDQLRRDYHALWQPANRYIADKVDDLVAKRFYLDRLKAVHTQYMQEIYREFSGEIQKMELFVTAKENVLMRLETRIRQAETAMSRIERDIQRLKKIFTSVEPSQKSLQTNSNPVTPAPPCRPDRTFDPLLGNSLDPEPEIRGPKAPETPETAPRV